MEGDWWTVAYLEVSINGGAPISGNLHLMLFAYYNWKVGYHRGYMFTLSAAARMR